MTTRLYTTRRYNKETYKFYLNTPDYAGEKGCCGIEIIPYITIETPANGLGYPDTVIIDNVTGKGRTMHRSLPKWIMERIEKTAAKIEADFWKKQEGR